MRCFTPGEKFELPNGDTLHAQIILTRGQHGESAVYQVLPDGVLAYPGVAGYRTLVNELGLTHRVDGHYYFTLSPLDTDDLQLLP